MPDPVGGRLVIRHRAKDPANPADQGDQGQRPIDSAVAVWVTPNARLIPKNRLNDFTSAGSAAWDGPFGGNAWVDGEFHLVVRATNRGDLLYPKPGQEQGIKSIGRIKLEGWVLGFNAGAAPADRLQLFNASRDETVAPGEDFVLVSDEFWKPTQAQITKYGDHYCVQANIYAKATAGGEGSPGTPADGEESGFVVNTYHDSHHAQRNIVIITKPAGETVIHKVWVSVAESDRCPLEANMALREAELPEDPARLRQLVGDHEGLELGLPCGDPMDKVTIEDEKGCPSDDLDFELEPGAEVAIKTTIRAYEDEQPGDVYGFDLVTTYDDGCKFYGGARVYVVVTGHGGGTAS